MIVFFFFIFLLTCSDFLCFPCNFPLVPLWVHVYLLMCAMNVIKFVVRTNIEISFHRTAHIRKPKSNGPINTHLVFFWIFLFRIQHRNSQMRILIVSIRCKLCWLLCKMESSSAEMPLFFISRCFVVFTASNFPSVCLPYKSNLCSTSIPEMSGLRTMFTHRFPTKIHLFIWIQCTNSDSVNEYDTKTELFELVLPIYLATFFFFQ